MTEKNKWRLVAMIAGGIILGIFLIDHFINYAAHASASYADSFGAGAACQKESDDLITGYVDCLDARYSDLKAQQAATDFLIKNYAVLQFPSCFKEFTYMTTSLEDALYVDDGNYMGWMPGNFSLYCWNNETDFFDCEDLCSVYS